ncbi:hypothetical protein [Rhizorhabdus dicambivorans]|uniref:hypothetical protein n=1 Tax=Rhizorhabdus dicambivorans TaxID=1850238 RepID=UPI0015967240|nr:hypothetical protein [Rhizorhabdus dicambivorans]
MDRCSANIEQGKANIASLVERRSRYTAYPHLREKLGVESFGEPVAERRACNART